jgi:Peptidase family M28
MRHVTALAAALLIGCAGRSTTARTPGPDGGLPPALDAIRQADLRTDLYAMAGDHFRGREAGTLDELKASAWLAERARDAGLEPAGDDGTYFQFWSMARVRISATSTLSIGGRSFAIGPDAVVVSGGNAVVDAPVVAAGDGRKEALEGLDLTGKAVVVQITPPARVLPKDVSLRPMRYAMAAIGERVAVLAQLHPAAIVMVSDAVADSGWGFASHWFTNGSYGLDFNASSRLGPNTSIPVIWVHRSAGPWLATPGQRLQATLFFERFTVPSVNVVARVPGTDPARRGEYVLFSGHQDHDGVKEPVAGDSIWNGADDNASVSVALLAIGRAFARHPAPRSALFVWHGAEEKGLLGSRYHAAHPEVPKDSIVAVINGDMIGGNAPDTAGLLGTQPPHRNSTDLVAMALQANDLVSHFVIDSSWDRPTHPEGWYFRSDHASYARVGVPAIYFSTLPHPRYHTPADEPDAIDYPKLTRMTRWMYATGWLVATAAERVRLDPGAKLER